MHSEIMSFEVLEQSMASLPLMFCTGMLFILGKKEKIEKKIKNTNKGKKKVLLGKFRET